MYKVPAHIKAHVNRIIHEYERLAHQGYSISLQVLKDKRMYSGVETTKFFLKSVKHFRNLLDTQDEYLTSRTEDEFRKKVYFKICEFYKPLSEVAILRITHSSMCQGQLESALRSAKKDPNLYPEAKFITWFISNACIQHWCDIDETICFKDFKLVKTEEAFEKILSGNKKYPTFEITQLNKMPFTRFRIALQIFSIEDCYRKQKMMHEYRTFWESDHNIEEFSTDCEIFNMWNNVSQTGIYYVYIPN